MADQDLDRNEAATPFKLQKAREKGQAARSTELAGSVVLLVAVAFVAWHGVETWQALLRVARVPLLHAGRSGWDLAVLWPLVAQLAGGAGAALGPLLLAVLLAGIAACVVQTGIVFSFEPLRMDFARLDPVAGCKRILSLRTLFDAGRACVKLCAIVFVTWLVLRALPARFAGIVAQSPAQFVRTLVEDAGGLGFRVALVLLLVALVDLAFSRGEFARRMRMSRRELKEEYRNREGDPRIRSRLRELRRELLRRSQSLKNTRTADVVLTNPTHFAIALRYVHGEMEAPRVVAKGAGKLAAAMREIAARHGVVVVQNPPLARRLFREAELDAYLPSSFHAEVARIIVWVLAARQQRLRLAQRPVA